MRLIKAISSWLPISYIGNGLIKTKNGGLCKIIEVNPINFCLKSEREQEEIVYQYKVFLKTCNFDMQILIYSKRTDLEDYKKNLAERIQKEKSEKVKELIEKFSLEIDELSINKNTVEKKFYIAFCSRIEDENQATKEINEKVVKIKNVLLKCETEIIDFGNDDDKILRILYEILNKRTYQIQKIGRDISKWSKI